MTHGWRVSRTVTHITVCLDRPVRWLEEISLWIFYVQGSETERKGLLESRGVRKRWRGSGNCFCTVNICLLHKININQHLLIPDPWIKTSAVGNHWGGYFVCVFLCGGQRRMLTVLFTHSPSALFP